MIINKQITDFWNKEFEGLNVSTVARQTKLSRQAIYNALKGECSQRTMDKINAYLEKRKSKLTNLVKTDEQD